MIRTIRRPYGKALSDHYTVVSSAPEGQTSRVVIAGSTADAAETHREHYPGRTIIRVVSN